MSPRAFSLSLQSPHPRTSLPLSFLVLYRSFPVPDALTFLLNYLSHQGLENMDLNMGQGSGVRVRECQIQPLILTAMTTPVETWMEKIETSCSLNFACFNLHVLHGEVVN